MEDLDPGTLGQSTDYQTCGATTAGGSDSMQGTALYAAGTPVGILGTGAINGRWDQQVQWGTHRRNQGSDTHQTIFGGQGTGGGQQKGADQKATEVNYGDKNWVSEYGGGTSSSMLGWKSVGRGRWILFL